MAWLESGETKRGFAALDSLVARHPEDCEVAKERVAALAAYGRLKDAEQELSHLLERWPGDVAVHKAAVHVAAQTEDVDRLIRHCGELIRLGPDRPDALEMAARVLGKFGQVELAASAADQLIAVVAGQHPVGHMTKFVLYESNGRLEEATRAIEDGLREFPHYPAFLRIHAMVANYRDDLDQAEIFARERAAGEAIDAEFRPLDQWPNNRNPDRKLRVGYVSSDFRMHAVANFMLGVVAAHDRNEIDVTLYQVWNAPDGITRQFEALDVKFWNCVGWGLEQIFAQVKADKIDVLVDLNGQSSGGVPELFALRPAPVQFTYLGYPGSTGSSRVHGRIVDSITDPEDAPWHATEARFHLDGGMLAYSPVGELPDVVMRSAEGPVRFGYLGNLFKISPSCIRAWKGVLDTVPGSVLVLAKPQFESEENRGRVRAQFADAGFDLDRLELITTGYSRDGFLAGYAEIDVSLDSMPYSGTTTVFESLAMGVPVLTVMGDSHRARVAGSILTHMGRPEWVASTPEQLAGLARAITADRGALANLRTTLREELYNSPVCDCERVANGLETVFREAWQSWCSS